MLNKYNDFLNSCCKSSFGDIPLKLNGFYKFEKFGDNMIYLKMSINLGYKTISIEEFNNKEIIKIKMLTFVNNYFTNIEKYELDDLYILAKNLIIGNEIDIYSYEIENIITEFENTIDYDILKEKYPNEINQISNIYINIYRHILNNLED
jgi:hypothetical protein